MTLQPANIFKDVEKIRENAPLVHNITNYVVMNTTANALLAIGASPVMAHAVQEVEDLAGIAGALVLNIGTLNDGWIDAMFRAAKTAKSKQVPIVLDPVGAGATPYRTQTAKDLIQAFAPSIIRGNGSEIMALCGQSQSTKGVDSTSESNQAVDAAKTLVREIGCTVCVTGETDYIVSAQTLYEVKNGHALMPRVTGLGCTATAICGAFAAVNPEFDKAAAHAMAVMGIAGEIAAEISSGPGTLQVNFIDALYQLSETDIKKRLKA
ncbi:hydroxyethylthiazole kinase [Desulfobacula toluolica]|uniref:Hydroxyethylthiazole kinase n=1 Tax=Desulfobacula toluolica (strain DSM 7467 / Tol2) TaxID=651182 RepID=K0NEU9_DESTT|nr:hydroxyethylthiazole kinase [Desulfobacula toluolica]CCK79465.1 ThiM: hydroxyethylthiazole kinase [Desulfobacula toluolica Tol2]